MKKVRRFNGEEDSYVEDTASRKANIDRALAEANKPEAMGEGNPKYNFDEFTAYQQESPSKDPFAEAAPAKAAPAAPAAPKAKPPIVTLQQLNAFKKEFGADKDLTDYMNKQQGLTRRGGATPPVSSNDRQMRDTSIGLGPTVEKAQALEAQSLEKKRRAAMEKSQALEPVYPEQALMGGAGVGIKSIAKAAQNLANRGGAKEAAKRVEPYLAKEAQMALPAPAKQLALPAPARQLGYDKAAGKTASKTAERNARTQGRQDEMSRENLRRYGMTDDTSRDAVNAVRENLGMGRGFKVIKKGGSVKGYASGGKVRSASSRADGIAIRGKTRA